MDIKLLSVGKQTSDLKYVRGQVDSKQQSFPCYNLLKINEISDTLRLCFDDISFTETNYNVVKTGKTFSKEEQDPDQGQRTTNMWSPTQIILLIS